MILTNLSQHYLTLGSFYQRKGFSRQIVFKILNFIFLYKLYLHVCKNCPPPALWSHYTRNGCDIVKLESALSLYKVAFTFTGVIHHFDKIESPSLNIALCFIDKNKLSGSRKEVYNVKSLQTV